MSDSAQVKLFILTPVQACDSELQLLTLQASKKNREIIKELWGANTQYCLDAP